MQIEGACHCGNIHYRLDWPGDDADIPARRCGCSFCVKHGGVWTSNPDATLDAVVEDRSALSAYAFGTRTAAFHICRRCGVPPFVVSRIDGNDFAVVNVNTFTNVDPATLDTSPADFDGEGTEDRLERRKRNWIGSVRVRFAAV